MVTLKYKLDHDLAKDPTRGSTGAACFDLYAAAATVEMLYAEYDTGICVEIPEGHVGLLFARSSVSNTGQWLANCVGVVDADFRGHIKARFYRGPGSTYYDIGDRVAQLMIVKLPEVSIEHVEQLSNTVRGDGGFGSSGR